MNGLLDFWNNTVLICAISGWLSAQILKTIIYACVNKNFRGERLFGAGGMPSSHSSLVCSLSTSILIVYGIGSVEFAICVIFAFITMYDAMGVRRETGNQAKVLNEMMESFKKMGDKNLTYDDKLKEFIGHTPIQVLVGMILGIVLAVVICAVRGYI